MARKQWVAIAGTVVLVAVIIVYVVASSTGPAYPPRASNLLIYHCENRSDALRQHPHMSDEWKQQVIDCVHFTQSH